MKKLLNVLLIFSISLPFHSNAQLKGDTYAQAKQKKSATIVYTYSEAPGFASRGVGGKMEGVCFDLMMKFAEYIETTKGIKLTVQHKTAKPNDFTYFLSSVKTANGGVFGLGNTTITEARKEQYNFSLPYITNVGMILTNKSVATVNDLSTIKTTFAGMTAVTVKNSTNEKSLLDIKKKHYPELKIEYLSSFGDVLNKVINDGTKFGSLDFTYYLDALKSKQSIKRHPGGDTSTEKFGIIMPKSNDWTPVLNEFMTSFTSSVEYRKVLSDNLGATALKFLDNIK